MLPLSSLSSCLCLSFSVERLSSPFPYFSRCIRKFAFSLLSPVFFRTSVNRNFWTSDLLSAFWWFLSFFALALLFSTESVGVLVGKKTIWTWMITVRYLGWAAYNTPKKSANWQSALYFSRRILKLAKIRGWYSHQICHSVHFSLSICFTCCSIAHYFLHFLPFCPVTAKWPFRKCLKVICNPCLTK